MVDLSIRLRIRIRSRLLLPPQTDTAEDREGKQNTRTSTDQ